MQRTQAEAPAAEQEAHDGLQGWQRPPDEYSPSAQLDTQLPSRPRLKPLMQEVQLVAVSHSLSSSGKTVRHIEPHTNTAVI